MEYVLVSLRLSLVRYGFVGVWGCFHGPSCIVLKMLQVHVFMRVSGGGGRGLWIPLKIAEIYSAKKVLHSRGLWQLISNTSNTRLHDLYQHLVPFLRNILSEWETKSHEKCPRNMCLMVPGVSNQK